MSPSEIAACLAYALSVWLAARNNIHTWWIGIIGSGLYAWVFYSVQLYADVTLQFFFIITSSHFQIRDREAQSRRADRRTRPFQRMGEKPDAREIPLDTRDRKSVV